MTASPSQHLPTTHKSPPARQPSYTDPEFLIEIINTDHWLKSLNAGTICHTAVLTPGGNENKPLCNLTWPRKRLLFHTTSGKITCVSSNTLWEMLVDNLVYKSCLYLSSHLIISANVKQMLLCFFFFLPRRKLCLQKLKWLVQVHIATKIGRTITQTEYYDSKPCFFFIIFSGSVRTA